MTGKKSGWIVKKGCDSTNEKSNCQLCIKGVRGTKFCISAKAEKGNMIQYVSQVKIIKPTAGSEQSKVQSGPKSPKRTQKVSHGDQHGAQSEPAKIMKGQLEAKC